MSTCEQIDAIIDLIFIKCIFEEVVSFEVLVGVSEDSCIFKGYCGGSEGMVKDDLVGRFSVEEIEVYVVFAGQMFVDWLCCRPIYFGGRSTAYR